MRFILFILTITSLIVLSPIVRAEQFQAPVTHTHWKLVSSPLECSLSQQITDFGEAKFSRHSGRELSLVFTTPSHPASQGNINFEISEASWQNSEQRLQLTSISSTDNQMQFAISGKPASQALFHLQEGRFPTLRYISQHMNEEVTAFMTTVHAADFLPDFQQCLADLYPYTFEDNRKLTINFELEKSQLNPKAKAKAELSKLAEYINLDDSIKRVVISGHTDNHGHRRLNDPLSESRAIVSKNFLVQQANVPENLITTSHHLERKPVATNKTLAGRAKNRRTEIELLR